MATDEARARDDLEWLLADLAMRRDTVRENRAYYDGRQQLRFATSYWRNTFGRVFKEATDNLCAPVVDAVAERLKVDGWDGPGAEQFDTLWKQARMPRLQHEDHLEALTTGDAFNIVWPSSTGKPTVWPQAADACAVQYDTEELGMLRVGGKLWRKSGTEWRATMYYRDVLHRFYCPTSRNSHEIPAAGKFMPVAGDDDPVVPNPWDRVPFAHYASKAKLGGYGRSELHDVRPIQDMLNKSVMDLLVGMEFASLPQRYGIGVEKPRDPVTGAEIEGDVQAGINRLWTVKNPAATLGQFDAADLSQIVEVVEQFRLEMARVSGTPPQYFFAGNNDWPAGVTLARLESRLVHKAGNRQDTFGDGHTQTKELLQLQNGQAVAIELVPRWVDASMPDPLTALEVAAGKKAVGVSDRQNLRELGYPEELIDEMLAENAVAMQPLDDALAAAMSGAGEDA